MQGLFLPPKHPDLGSGKLSALLAPSFARTCRRAALLGTLVWGIVGTPDASRHLAHLGAILGILCARIWSTAVGTDLNAYPAITVRSRADWDGPNVVPTGAVNQDSFAMSKPSCVTGRLPYQYPSHQRPLSSLPLTLAPNP